MSFSIIYDIFIYRIGVILMAKPSNKRLNIDTKQKNYLLKKLGINSIEEIDIILLKRLKEALKKLTDSRQSEKAIYKLWDVIMCVILANFSNVYSWDDIHDFVIEKYDWLRSFLKMTGGIPSAKTYERIFSIIDYKQLEEILNEFLFEIVFSVISNKDIISIDGRVSRGSARKETDFNYALKPLNVLSAYSFEYGACLASEMIDDKTNEIPNIPTILGRFRTKGCIITWDALNTQKENVAAVINNKGDYVVPIKGNHGTFYNELVLYFDDKKIQTIIAGNTKSTYLKHVEKSHSSFITYEYFQTNDINWFHDKDSWKGLKTIGLVRKTIEKNNEITIENRYYISSLNLNINDFSNAIRNEWAVENKLHWHLDFTFKEDSNTTANKNALMNMQIINKFCLAVLNKIKPFYNDISLRRIRNKISYNFEREFINILCYLALS